MNQSWPEPDSSTLALAHLLPSNTRQPRELKIPHTTKACYPLQKDSRILHVKQTRIQPWKAVLHTYPNAQSGPDSIHKASWQIRFNSQLTLSTMQNRWNGPTFMGPNRAHEVGPLGGEEIRRVVWRKVWELWFGPRIMWTIHWRIWCLTPTFVFPLHLTNSHTCQCCHIHGKYFRCSSFRTMPFVCCYW